MMIVALAALVFASSTTSLTPEEEVEAWQPKYVEREIDEEAMREGNLRVASVAVPVLSTVGGAVSGVVAAYGAYAILQNGLVGASSWAPLSASPRTLRTSLAGSRCFCRATFRRGARLSPSSRERAARSRAQCSAERSRSSTCETRIRQGRRTAFVAPDLIIIPLAPLIFAAVGGAVATSVSVGMADATLE